MPAATKTILRDLAVVLHIPGVMALASLPVAWWFDEEYAYLPLLWTAVLALTVSQTLFRLFRQAGSSRLPHALIIAALSWAIVPLLGALPIQQIASHLATNGDAPETLLAFTNTSNALFEAYSGFTSTGLTMALRPSELPHILQWWRTFMEWIGGVGIIILFLSVLDPAVDASSLYSAEGRERKIWPSLTATVRTIWWIYLLYTVISILALRVVGVPWWQAINHGMTGIATGGFAITDESIGAYGLVVQAVVVLMMITGAISFATHHELLHGRHFAGLWKGAQVRVFWLILIVGALLLLLELFWTLGVLPWNDAIFVWTSALTTCGFTTTSVGEWSPAPKLLLVLAMVVGGSGGSTAGGLKIFRAVALFKGLLWRFRRLGSSPHAVLVYRVEDEALVETEAIRKVEAAAVYGMLWFLTLLGGTLVMLHFVTPAYGFIDVIFEIASALGSVGLSSGITDPSLAWQGKTTLILLMWMGRLEIVPALFLIVSLISVPLRYRPSFGR